MVKDCTESLKLMPGEFVSFVNWRKKTIPRLCSEEALPEALESYEPALEGMNETNYLVFTFEDLRKFCCWSPVPRPCSK